MLTTGAEINHNNKIANQSSSVVAELDELESLLLLMLSSNMSTISLDSRKHLIQLAYRLVSLALDKTRTSDAN